MMVGDPSDDAARAADVSAVAVSRDRAAFARLFRFFAPRIKTYLRRLGATEETAEELAQDVLVSVWRRAAQYDPAKAAVSTWVYTIARNRRIDALRRERRPEYIIEDFEVGTADAPRGDVYSEVKAVQRVVARAVNDLPPEQAQLLRIFYFDEKPHSVIAEELGLPLGTVKSRLRLAMAKLRTALGGLDA